MKFRATENIKLRSNPSINSVQIGNIPKGLEIESDEYSWKSVTLPDGTKGFCVAIYLQTIQEAMPLSTGVWKLPVPKEYFVLSQIYLNEDWNLYPKFGHHTGADYGGHGSSGIPLFACADGEIVYREAFNSAWGATLGNHAALYIPSIDKTFLYCHMADKPHDLGPVKSGEQIGIMGNTGKSAGRAIHLHLEGFNGRFNIVMRSFSSLDEIKKNTFDAHQFIQSRLT